MVDVLFSWDGHYDYELRRVDHKKSICWVLRINMSDWDITSTHRHMNEIFQYLHLSSSLSVNRKTSLFALDRYQV